MSATHLELPYSIDAKNPFLLDKRSGPWASKAAANAGIPEAVRVQGLVVIVQDAIVGYYYKDGIEDVDLVPINTDEYAVWSQISGNLADQADLQAALDAKEDDIAAGTTGQYWRGDKTWQTLDTSNVPENGAVYFTQARARQSIDVTTTGNNGAATYNNTTGIINIPQYTLAGLGGEPAIALGTSLQYWRGDKSWQTLNTDAVPEATAKYYTDARVLAYGNTQWPRLDGSYTNPSWIVSLPWSKITNTPTTIAGYGITDAFTEAESDARYVKKAGDIMTGNLLIAAPASIDSTLVPGQDILNLGTANASVINIGWSGATINIQGSVMWQDVDNLAVTDKLIRLNKGGAAASGVSSGFEIEENAVITGWFATDSTRTGWDFKAPASQQLTLGLDLLTASRTIKMPNLTGTLLIDAATYSDPAWLATLAWSKITGTPTTLSGYGITNAYTKTEVDSLLTNYVPIGRQLTINGVAQDLSTNRSWTVGDVRTDSSYSNPTWLTALAWSKITGTPTTLGGYGISDAYTTTQINAFFFGSTPITGYNKSNWDTAFGWGNHASAGYVLRSGDTMTGHLSLNNYNLTNVGTLTVYSSSGNPSVTALRGSYFGYSNTYPTVIVGSTSGTISLLFGVDLISNPSGAYTGDGSEYFWRNTGSFKTPNAANTNYNTLFSWGSSGVVTFPSTISASIDGNSATTTLWGGKPHSFTTSGSINTYMMAYSGDGYWRPEGVATIQSFLGLGSAAYTSSSAYYAAGSTVANSTLLQGYSAVVASTANTIALRDGSGYLRAVFYYDDNTSVSGSGITSIYGGNGDRYMYKFTAAAVQSFLGLGSYAYRSSGLAELSGDTFTGVVIGNSGFRVPNGQFFQAVRSTGSAVVNILGFESGTDDLIQVFSNSFKLRNTGAGDAANMFTVSVSGNGTFTGTATATSFIGAGSALTSVPSNAALYPTFNQNTTGTAASLSAVLSSTLGGAGSVNGILKANGSGTVSAAVAGTDYVAPSALSGYLPLTAGVGNSLSGSLYLNGNGTNPRYIILNESASYAGSFILQAGGGSSGFGGGFVMYGHSHASKAGWVTAGISNGSGGKFSVNNQGLGAGTDVFTVGADGVVTATAQINGTSAAFSGAGTFGGEVVLKNGGRMLSNSNATTGDAYYRISNTNGDYFIGADNVSGSSFGFGAYGSGFYIPASTNFSISQAGTTSFRISSGGNTLIKTTTDNGTDALQVAGSGLFTGTIKARGGYVYGETNNSVLRLDEAIGALVGYTSTFNNYAFFDANGATIATAGTTRFSINNSGAATFSSTLGVTGQAAFGTSVNTTNDVFIQGTTSNNTRNALRVQNSSAASLFAVRNDGDITLYGPTSLSSTLSVTGAATFSSSVTAAQFAATSSANAGSFTTSGTTDYSLVALGSSGGLRNIFLAGQTGYSNGFTVQYNGSAMVYTMNNGNLNVNGAGTFTSNVTAASAIFSGASYVNTTANNDWAFQAINNGTTSAHGLYVNIGASSTGTVFRVDKGGSSLLTVTNGGSLTMKEGVWHTSDGGNRFYFNSDTYIGIKSGGTWYFQNGSAVNVVTINSAGAATFSSSVTASSFSGAGTNLTGYASGFGVNYSYLLVNQADYGWSQSTLPNSYSLGLQHSFVSDGQGWPNYGSVINMRSYSGGGSALQMFVPYSPTYGGTRLALRFGNYDVSSGNSWTGWKYLLSDVTDPYAYNMNQYVRTTDNVTFNTVTATTFTGTVTNISVNYSNNSAGSYQMIWGSGTALYGTAGIYCDPLNDIIYASKFSETSDRSLKTPVQENFLLPDIHNIKAHLYTKNGILELGYYAQEVQPYLPHAVSIGNGKHLNLTYREVFVAKISSLEDRTEQLERRVKELETELAKLKMQ